MERLNPPNLLSLQSKPSSFLKGSYLVDITWFTGVPPWAFVFLYAGITSIPFPATRLAAIGAGALYGLYVGFAAVYAGALLGASCGFLASRYALAHRFEPLLRARFPRIFSETDEHASTYLWSLRLSPLFSFALVHYAMGLTRIPFSRYFFITAACSSLYSAAYVVLGGALRSWIEARGGTVPWQAIALLAILAFIPLVPRLRRAYLARKARQNQD